MLSSKKKKFISKHVELLKTKAKNKRKKVVTKHTFVYSQNMKISKVKISKLNNNPEPLESPDPPQCNPPKARSRTSSNQTRDHMLICSQALMESRIANSSIMEQIGHVTFGVAILVHRSPWPMISLLNPLCFLWSILSPWPQASPPFPLTLIDIILCKWGLPLCLAHQEHL